ARGERIAKHVGDAGGEARWAADLFGEDEIARLGRPELGDGELAPLLLLDGTEPEAALPFLMHHAEHELAALQQLLHRVRGIAVAALLGAGEDAVADAEG